MTIKTHPDALVVAGGGAKAFAALGAVHVLKKMGRLDNLKTVAGTSAGAIVAAGVALGRPPLDMCKAFVRERYVPKYDIKKFGETFGLDTGEHLDKWIEFVLDGEHTFESIKRDTGIDLIVCATDLNDRKAKYFDPKSTPTVDVATALRMSCAIPLYFSAVAFEGRVYVDGALCDNFPYEFVATRDGVDAPLGIAYAYDGQTGPVENFEQYVTAIVHCATDKQHVRDRANVLTLECGDTKLFDFKNPRVLRKLFKSGVLQTNVWIKKNE